ncbi:GNAT family N-acetyltransferase [Diaphorobacter caeni]|uniref:GNAT family N-acetyltransferase n=1 Tax=Diaphorobacter caeni TaxID=2784387 RepID=UPI00188F3553|nr:GNAT family N-acetyltransferase [Diaphorobacter caeni]MBF5004224.1 GNAT family N-acetyltransferase [Diaphorobacter caeni]
MRAEFPATVQVGELTLRDAVQDDYPFLREVYRGVRAPELAQTAWTQWEKDAFCDSQFALQDRHYRAHYPHARYFVIELHSRSIGRLYLSDAPELMALMEISLLQELRAQGHGTALMQWLTQIADDSARRMRLFVEPENPARRLYERFGFVEHELQGAYLKMFREPQPTSTAQNRFTPD